MIDIWIKVCYFDGSSNPWTLISFFLCLVQPFTWESSDQVRQLFEEVKSLFGIEFFKDKAREYKNVNVFCFCSMK